MHPNYTQRLWAKILIKEFGLNSTVDSIYFIRRESGLYLRQKLGVDELEIPYEQLKQEVLNRMINNLILKEEDAERFLEYFERADFRLRFNS